MSKFERGIKSFSFIDALNDLRKDPNSYWSKIVQDKDLFIAIRKERIHVYFQGNRLCELTYKNGNIVGETMYKFLLNPALLQKNFTFINGKCISPAPLNLLTTSYTDLHLIKSAMSVYYGEEKNGVHEISISVANILDVEIAFEKDPLPPKTRKSTDRIDFLRLEKQNDQLKLVFYEAKLFTNKEIRKPKGVQPPVIDQLHDYIKALKKHEPVILDSYVLVCKNLQDLGLLKSKDLANSVFNKHSFNIDPIPRLVIFGFDEDQRTGKIHTEHLENIRSFTNCPIIAKGNPKNFKSLS
ncbi:MAG: hypothetical protein NTU98_08170 [Bacteroidetes bacterium]|nr:hypothetical protein [Bacteroidota bacterium]